MPESPFEAAGAQIRPTAAADLHTNEFFTGLWTQGNPLGPGAVPYLYQKFYSGVRFDRLIAGYNTEISARLTLRRRYGHLVYNPGPFPPINRFYEFRAFRNNAELIHIVASVDPASGSTQGTVREVTAPETNTILWTKDPAAGRTCFLNVGNILYFADGVDAKKWITSGKSWVKNTVFNPGDFIRDSNDNMELSTGAQTATITNVQVDALTSPPNGRLVSLYFSPSTPLTIESNIALTLAGLTTVPSLNGTTPYTVVVDSSFKAHFVRSALGGNPPVTPYSSETGTASTGNGTTGATEPVWNTSVSLATQDGGQQWINMGPAVQGWGMNAPTIAPIVTQTSAPTIYPAWAANTWYASLFVILDSNNNLQQLTTAGTTKTGGAPSWNTTVGGTTADGTAVWTNMGAPAWAGSTAYVSGAVVIVTFTYTVNVTQGQSVPYPPYYIITTVQQQVTVTQLFACVTAGTSGPNPPGWTNGLGTLVQDGTVVWANRGNENSWPGAAQALSLTMQVVDSNGSIETAQNQGKSGTTAPTWATSTGASTVDNAVTWLNKGPYTKGNTAPWIWAYSGKNSITGHISTPSPLSQPLTVSQGQFPVIQGAGLSDPQEDTIVLWRTVQGGSVLMYDDEFPNPGAGQIWIYTDTNQDPSSTASPQQGQLNFLITAPINSVNNPPPAGWTPQAYYLNRIWGFVGPTLIWSGGPDTITGSGNESFPPLNQTTFPSAGVTCWPTSIGLIVYTNSDVWVMLGQGTANSPFYVVNFQQGVGLSSQDAFCVNGSTAYGMLSSGQVVSMDPGAGELEIGFPIGDQFDTLYIPANTYFAWHPGASADMALYVADGSLGWFRMAAVAAPESGNVWSPRALIQGGVKAIASIETRPGRRGLILGPAAAGGGPILIRDKSASDDNGAPYEAYADIGSIVMAQPGGRVQVQYIVTEEMAIPGSTPAYVAVLFDEIYGTFATLRKRSNDPPNLPASQSVTTSRWWVMQDAGTIPICRHMQVRIGWTPESFANELFTYSIYGRLPEKARK